MPEAWLCALVLFIHACFCPRCCFRDIFCMHWWIFSIRLSFGKGIQSSILHLCTHFSDCWSAVCTASFDSPVFGAGWSDSENQLLEQPECLQYSFPNPTLTCSVVSLYIISIITSVYIQCAAKKVSPKVFCDFLSNRSEFLHEISHNYYSFITT